MAKKLYHSEDEGLSPGELYRNITVSAEDFEKEKGKLVKKRLHPYVQFCRDMNKRFPGQGKGAKFTKETREAVEFLGWDLTPAELAATAKIVLAGSVAVAFLLGTVLLLSPLSDFVRGFAAVPLLVPVYIYFPFLIAALYIVNLVQTYPLNEAKIEQVHALTHVPEIMGYMIMSIKLVPNLEKAVEFSAEHGRGRISDEFKKAMWEVQIGAYATLSEALDSIAYRWGKFSSEFKLALMRIRASVIENTEAKRYAMLDKTMEEMLESIRGKMEQYARNLSQPSVMLFYIGVLLPLLLIIILPVGSTFSGTALANPWLMVLLYNIILPIIVIAFVLNLVRSRPPTYEPPKIPNNYPGLPPKWKMPVGGRVYDMRFVIAVILIVGFFVSGFITFFGIPPTFMIEEQDARELQIIPYTLSEQMVLEEENLPQDYFLEGGEIYSQLVAEGKQGDELLLVLETRKTLFYLAPEHDTTPYPLVFGMLISLSLCFFIYMHYSNIYKRRAQEEVMEMETEFKDSLYVLASRMAENKPVEEALKHTKEFLPELKISQTIFARTLDNINLLGMPLEAAVFDANYGSLKTMPSNIIRSSMRLLVDSVNLGVNVAARTLMSLSMQLNNSEKVNKTLKVLLGDINGMLTSMSVLIAPLVLGITTGLQKVVTVTIYSLAESPGLQAATSGASRGATNIPGMDAFSAIDVGGLVDPSVLGQSATPLQFLIIVSIYVVQLVVIMTYFTTNIEEENDILFRINLAKALPIALIMFLVSVVGSNLLIGSFM